MWGWLYPRLGSERFPTIPVNEPAMGKKFSEGLKYLSEPKDFELDIVFIHEITEPGDDARLLHKLKGEFPSARIAAFGYDAANITTLDGILDTERLDKAARMLFKDCLLQTSERSSTSTSSQREKGEEQKPRNDDTRRVVFIAHGFGGIIYEKAITIAYGRDGTNEKKRKHAAALLGTPHNRPGMTHNRRGVNQWAIMCAKRLGVPCEDTAEKQDWSPYKQSLATIESMQSEFEKIINNLIEIDITTGYATMADDVTKSMIQSAFMILPKFTVFGLDTTHFDIPNINADDSWDYRTICDRLREQVDKLIHDPYEARLPKPFKETHERSLTSGLNPKSILGVIPVSIRVANFVIEYYSRAKPVNPDISNLVKRSKYLLAQFDKIKEFYGLKYSFQPVPANFKSYPSEPDAIKTCIACIKRLLDVGDYFLGRQEALTVAYLTQPSTIASIMTDLDTIFEQLSPILDSIEHVVSSAMGTRGQQISASSCATNLTKSNLRAKALSCVKGWAFERKDIPLVSKLTKLGIEIPQEKTPLQIAAGGGDDREPQFLRSPGRDEDTRVKEGLTALHDAAEKGDVVAGEMIIQGGSSIDSCDIDGRTPLHLAASGGQLAFVELLINEGADIFLQDKDGETMFHKAARNGLGLHLWDLIPPEQMKVLLHAENKQGRSALHVASERGVVTLVEKILPNLPLPKINLGDTQGLTPLHLAVENNHVPIVAQLLNAQADVNSRTRVDITSLPDDTQTSLYWAAQRVPAAIISEILTHTEAEYGKINTTGLTPLHGASRNGHRETVKLLLQRDDVLVDAEDVLGRSAECMAAQYGHVEILDLLIEKADVAKKPIKWKSAYSIAVRNCPHSVSSPIYMRYCEFTADEHGREKRSISLKRHTSGRGTHTGAQDKQRHASFDMSTLRSLSNHWQSHDGTDEDGSDTRNIFWRSAQTAQAN